MISNDVVPLLRMQNIHVSYDDCKALKGVDFDLYPGEIHGLVGEHRAGKSTLVKLLSGAVRKEQGLILFKETPIEYFTPQSATRHKIGIIYQHLNVLPTLNAVENIFAGRNITTWWGGVNYPPMEAAAKAIFARMGVEVPLDTPLEFLPEEKRQMVELAKVLSIDPEIIIFDEISSKLTPPEMESIYKFLFEWKARGKSVIYISHNMDEIFELADRVTILRNGYRVGTEEMKDIDKIKLIKLTYSFVLSREELAQDNRELYLLKRYNEHILQNLPEGILILDPDQTVYLINYAAIRILELEQCEITGWKVEHIFKNNIIEQADDILAKIRDRTEYVWEELESGRDKTLRLRILPFKDENYKLLGTIIIIEDISKERSFNEYLLRTEKIASVAELAAGVAHELNNPLGIIQNYVAVLKEQRLEPDSLERLSKIEHEVERMVDIIENLLSFSKVKKLPLKRLNLAVVLDETVMLINHKLREKHIRMLWEPPFPDALVFGDENRLKQVFINLLMNAIEAAMDDGQIELALRLHQEGQYVEVTVIDNGCGIPEELREKIFDPFFSTKAGKKNTGLGLPICQHIIESHQGIITCSSAERTIFTVRLPLIEPSPIA